MIVNFFLLSIYSTEKWVNFFNESMKNFYRKYYGEFIEEEQIKNHETIPRNSRLRLEWLLPGKRKEFLDIFLQKNFTKGHFDGTQWNEISQMTAELQNQQKVSKIGFNSLKLAARKLGIKYFKAKQYFREIPKKMFKRWSLGRQIPKLTQEHKENRVSFAKAFEDKISEISKLLITDESTVQAGVINTVECCNFNEKSFFSV